MASHDWLPEIQILITPQGPIQRGTKFKQLPNLTTRPNTARFKVQIVARSHHKAQCSEHNVSNCFQISPQGPMQRAQCFKLLPSLTKRPITARYKVQIVASTHHKAQYSAVYSSNCCQHTPQGPIQRGIQLKLLPALTTKPNTARYIVQIVASTHHKAQCSAGRWPGG